jgi:hypothetical protein
MNNKSVFKIYLEDNEFIDRYKKDLKNAVDVIIPVVHTNELWEKNLKSIYREIPVKRLLIGDGGCIDDSLKIAKKFPRVKIYDHKKYISLGYSIKKLIEEVKTDWFIYLHSDVYLPDGWFEIMCKNKKKYDWFECRQHMTVMIDYPLDYPARDRPFSGSQMGRKGAFTKILTEISDDYLYRNEDMIFTELITRQGLKYGRVKDAFHFHQMMNKKSHWQRTIKNVSFNVELNPKEENRVWIMQIKGIVKYCDPDKEYLIHNVMVSLTQLHALKDFDLNGLKKWVEKTNPKWLPYIDRKITIKEYIAGGLARVYRLMRDLLIK